MRKAASGQGVAQSGAIDLAHLERATFGDHALRREVLSLFRRQAAALGAELAQTDSERLRADIAHRLRGAALGVGAMAVAEAAAAFERAPENADQLAEAVARLAASIAEARTAIAKIIGGN